MTASFPLAGLLRLRRLEEDRAGARLGARTSRHAALAAHESRARADAEQIPTDVESMAALQAVAAARASSLSMLGELQALTAAAQAEREAAEREFVAARARTVGLEKLEARHAAAAAAAELAGEQAVLDELGGVAHHRARAEGEGA